MYVISYDISNDRLRNKLAKLLEGHGRRVQYSVFECRLTEKQFSALYEKIVCLLSDTGEDGIRIYKLCGKCENNIRTIGVENSLLAPEEEDLFII